MTERCDGSGRIKCPGIWNDCDDGVIAGAHDLPSNICAKCEGDGKIDCPGCPACQPCPTCGGREKLMRADGGEEPCPDCKGTEKELGK